MFSTMKIMSHKGPYSVIFDKKAFKRLEDDISESFHFVIDKKVARLYARELKQVLTSHSVLHVKATERNKTLDKFTGYVEHLVSKNIRRGHILVAIGGGIIQDIVCFLAATLLRGLSWHFYPTTLLAQADSCIGSKSSINVGNVKNVLGTFTPPDIIYITPHVLGTLEEREIHSGLGEMLKVHAIDSPTSFDKIAADYEKVKTDPDLMQHYIQRSLEIKKQLIEIDEFDHGPRNVMNYGHSFGHAIESASEFAIPHGIAVTMGMDVANYLAYRLGITDKTHFNRMHPTLAFNFSGFENVEIKMEDFLAAMDKDKKHTDHRLRLILPDAEGRISVGQYSNDAAFQDACAEYFQVERYG